VPGVWERTKNIFQAKANKVLDKHEDPRESLDLSYEKQLDSLQKVRRSVADVATARKRIELQATQLQKQADKLQDQAKAALSRLPGRLLESPSDRRPREMAIPRWRIAAADRTRLTGPLRILFGRLEA